MQYRYVLIPGIEVGESTSSSVHGRTVERTQVAYESGDVRLVVAHLTRLPRERNDRSLTEVQYKGQRIVGIDENNEAVYGLDSRGSEYTSPGIGYDGLLAGLALANQQS